MDQEQKHEGTIRHWLNPGEPLFDDAIEAIAFALVKGYSVVFIKRIFAMKKAKFLYDVIRKEQLICTSPLRKIKHDPLPPDLINALDEIDLGYFRWCNARTPELALDPVATAKALSAPMVRGDLASESAHHAFCADFCNLYRKNFGTELIEIAPYPQHLGPTPRLTYIITPKNPVYVAHTKEHGPEIFRSDLNPDKALRKLRNTLSVRWGIKKLHMLQDRHPVKE